MSRRVAMSLPEIVSALIHCNLHDAMKSRQARLGHLSGLWLDGGRDPRVISEYGVSYVHLLPNTGSGVPGVVLVSTLTEASLNDLGWPLPLASSHWSVIDLG